MLLIILTYITSLTKGDEGLFQQKNFIKGFGVENIGSVVNYFLITHDDPFNLCIFE